MVVHTRSPRALLVNEAGQAKLAITLTPQPDLVVVHADDVRDITVGRTLGRHQYDPRSFANLASIVPERIQDSNTSRSP